MGALSARFRWRFHDDAVGEDLTDWHTDTPTCAACCCWKGPDANGEHRAPAGQYDQDGWMDWSAHTYCNPHEHRDVVEWQVTPDRAIADQQAPELAP